MRESSWKTAALAVAAVTVVATGCSSGADSSTRAEARAQNAAQRATTPAPSASASAPVKTGDGKLVVSYARGTTVGDTHAQGFLEEHKVLQGVAAYANSRIKLAYDVPLKAATCADGAAFWSSETKDITYCYDFANLLRGIFEQQETAGTAEQKTAAVDSDVVGMTNGALFHELGHGLVDMYDLPITGREEDVADQLSVLLLASGDETHRDYAVSTINAWAGLAQDEADFPPSYADEHSLDSQRFYNWTCWLYGSDPETYASVVQTEKNPDGVLPLERAERCPDEFDKINRSWSTLLQPYLKEPAGN